MDNDPRIELQKIMGRHKWRIRFIRFRAFLRSIPPRIRWIGGLPPTNKSVGIYWNPSKNAWTIEPLFQELTGFQFSIGEQGEVILNPSKQDIVTALLKAFTKCRFRRLTEYLIGMKGWRDRVKNNHYVLASLYKNNISFQAHVRFHEGRGGGYLPVEHEKLELPISSNEQEIFALLEKALKYAIEKDTRW